MRTAMSDTPQTHETPTDRHLRWLVERHGMDSAAAAALNRTAQRLFERLRPAAGGTLCLSLSGPPGSGKSTLAALLCRIGRQAAIATAMLSLDDYYLPRAARRRLAEKPYWRQRGLPGTHDAELLLQDIRSLIRKRAAIRTPRFDKGLDDRLGPEFWHHIAGQPALLIVEGWCLNLTPLPKQPAKIDETIGREAVNRCLQTRYAELFDCFDQRWYLQAPDWPSVVDWRWRQARMQPGDFHRRDQVESFLTVFKPWVEQMNASARQWADLVIPIGRDHRPRLS